MQPGPQEHLEEQHGHIQAGHAPRIPDRDIAGDAGRLSRGEPDQPGANHHSAAC